MRPKILIVEDNPDGRESLRLLLSQEFDVTPAKALSEAKLAIEHLPFNLVLLDLILPDSGLQETLTELRTLCPGIPVIAYSGCSDVKSACIRAGAKDFVAKPVDPTKLFEQIYKAMAWEKLKPGHQEFQDKLDRARDVVAASPPKSSGGGT